MYGVVEGSGVGIGLAERQGAKHPVVVAVGKLRQLRVELLRCVVPPPSRPVTKSSERGEAVARAA